MYTLLLRLQSNKKLITWGNTCDATFNKANEYFEPVYI